jgi:guanylate kinase
MRQMASGNLFIVCGPSGVGKSSLCRRLLKEFSTLHLSISHTTRAPRGVERDGEAYHFVTAATFASMVGAGAFAEHASVHGNCYGSSRTGVQVALDAGEDVLFDIDYQGAQQLKTEFPAACAIIVMPPSMAALEARLRGRKTDTDEVIERRMAAARHELSQCDTFDYAVVNDQMEAAYDALRSVYVAQRHDVTHLQRHLQTLLDG